MEIHPVKWRVTHVLTPLVLPVQATGVSKTKIRAAAIPRPSNPLENAPAAQSTSHSTRAAATLRASFRLFAWRGHKDERSRPLARIMGRETLDIRIRQCAGHGVHYRILALSGLVGVQRFFEPFCVSCVVFSR